MPGRDGPAGIVVTCSASSPPASPTAAPSSSSSRACPPACRSRSRTSSASWPAAASATAAGPACASSRTRSRIVGGVRHGRTLGSPVAIEIGNTEWERSDKWHEEMSPAPGAHRGAAHPAPARPRRPGRHAEVRLHRRPRRARAGLGPRDRGPGGGRRAGQGAAAPPRRRRSCRTWCRWARCGPRPPTRPGPADLDRVDASEVRCFDPAAEEAMVERDQGRGQGRRLARRRRRGARLRRAGRARQPRPLGPQARRPAGRRRS